MDARQLRRELGKSARLHVSAERWLFAGLFAGAVGYLIWLAGTGVAVSRLATAAAGSTTVDPWTSQATVLAAVYGLLWVVIPSILVVRFVVGDLTNIRGNIEQRYRVDSPLVLLAPPLVLVGLGATAVFVRGANDPVALALLAVANGLLLVRTVAYGYRVYSFSTPRLLQAMVLVAAVVATLAVVSRADALVGDEEMALVRAAADRAGVTDVAFGSVRRAGLTAETLPLAAVAAPAVLALGYLAIQLVASLVVRIRRPDVPRSAIRAGQRYPAVVQPGTSRRLAMGTGRGGAASAGAAGNAGSASGDDDGSADGASSDPDGSAAADGSVADAGSPDGDETSSDSDDGGDRFGQTRVYTPPEEGDDPFEDASSAAAEDTAVKSELCPICGSTYEAASEPSHCPNCNAVLDAE